MTGLLLAVDVRADYANASQLLGPSQVVHMRLQMDETSTTMRQLLIAFHRARSAGGDH